jgi:hypothetical protein
MFLNFLSMKTITFTRYTEGVYTNLAFDGCRMYPYFVTMIYVMLTERQELYDQECLTIRVKVIVDFPHAFTNMADIKDVATFYLFEK